MKNPAANLAAWPVSSQDATTIIAPRKRGRMRPEPRYIGLPPHFSGEFSTFVPSHGPRALRGAAEMGWEVEDPMGARAPESQDRLYGSKSSGGIPGSALVMSEAGTLAARHLLGLGMANLFFICNGITALREAFLSACEAAAKPAQVLQPVGGEPTARAAWLLETLAGLPLPCAIFAGHDRHAVEVIAAAAEIGLEVPKQVAVLGVGNDGRYLQRSRIALSSVDLQRSPARLVARHSTETYVCEVPGVAKAVLKIRNRYSEPLTVPAMARECGMSVRNLYRLYRATTGNTIGKDLMARRMEAAAELLRDPKLKLEPIALETGLGSAKNLCRLFKDYFGQTPGQWRETWRTSGCE